MELKKKEHESQFSVWIAASVLLHLLILLIIFLWYIGHIFHRHFMQKQQPSTETIQKPLDQKKDLQMKPQDPSVSYTLMPGRKAITTPLQTNQPETKKEEPIPEQKETPTPPIKPSTIELPKQDNKAQNAFKANKEISPLEKLKQQLTKPVEQDHASLEKPENQENKNTADTTKEPTIQKKKVTLQDLKLGFSKFMQEGNNDILIQHGTNNQPPDAMALKLITYRKQVAHTMRDAIFAHNQWHLITNQRGKYITLVLSLNREGKPIRTEIAQESNDTLLNKIVLEALQDIKLYPPVPKHIPEDPYTQPWKLLF